MNKEEIKKDYKAGLTYVEIAKKHNITKNQLIYLIQKEKWKRKSNKSRTHKGNQNAKGNKGGHAPKGNKNALTTGEYETIFSNFLSKKEKEILEANKRNDKQQYLLEELDLLTIREFRMLERIKKLQKGNRDMTVQNMSKSTNGNSISTTTNVENTTIAIQRIEEALTKVQQAKRRVIESLSRIGLDSERLEIEKSKLEIEKKRLELELQNAEGEEIEDLSETDSDIYGS